MSHDPVENPSHYTGSIETIDYIRAQLSTAEWVGYCKGNAIKYISRAGKKEGNDPRQDVKKAIWYLTWLTGEDPRKKGRV